MLCLLFINRQDFHRLIRPHFLSSLTPQLLEEVRHIHQDTGKDGVSNGEPELDWPQLLETHPDLRCCLAGTERPLFNSVISMEALDTPRKSRCLLACGKRFVLPDGAFTFVISDFSHLEPLVGFVLPSLIDTHVFLDRL